MAQRIGADYQLIEKYEAGQERVPPDLLLKIAEALDVSIPALFEGLRSTPRDDVGQLFDPHFLERPETFEMLGQFYAQPAAVRRALLGYLNAINDWRLST